MPRGGPRPGAGRPRKETLYTSEIRAAERQVADKLPHLVTKLLELADGVTVRDEDEKTGEAHVYQRPPDIKALTYLLDRLMGRPTERVDMDADVHTTGGDEADHLTNEQRAAVRAALLRPQRGPGDS